MSKYNIVRYRADALDDNLNGDADKDYKICPRCKGDGWEDEYDEIPCDVCYGDGEIPA